MSRLEKIRAIAALSISAAALTALFVLPSSERQTELAGTLCATSKGALCEGLRNDRNESDSPGHVSVTNLGHMTVIARRGTATFDEVTHLGAMTVTASRLPNMSLAERKPESEARSF